MPESSIEILGHSVAGVTYRHYAHRAPLAFRAIMTLPQPSAFAAMVNGFDGHARAAGGHFGTAADDVALNPDEVRRDGGRSPQGTPDGGVATSRFRPRSFSPPRASRRLSGSLADRVIAHCHEAQHRLLARSI